MDVSARGKPGRRALLTGAMLVAIALGGCEKWRLDARVRELCAKDGGMRIHETVTLPPEQFDQWGMVKFYRPTEGENALGPEYVFVHEVIYFRRGNPQMTRERYSITRRMDGKLLGESVLYGRGGGDMPGPWHESSLSCPETHSAGPNALIQAVMKVRPEGAKL